MQKCEVFKSLNPGRVSLQIREPYPKLIALDDLLLLKLERRTEIEIDVVLFEQPISRIYRNMNSSCERNSNKRLKESKLFTDEQKVCRPRGASGTLSGWMFPTDKRTAVRTTQKQGCWMPIYSLEGYVPLLHDLSQSLICLKWCKLRMKSIVVARVRTWARPRTRYDRLSQLILILT